MKYFWIRLILFVVLWSYSIMQYSNNIGLSILFFAAALGVFFFFSLQQVPVYVYLLLSLVIMLHGVFATEENPFTIILLFYVSIISALRLRDRELKFYLGTNFIVSIVFSFYQQNDFVATVVISGFFYFLIVSFNELIVSLNEQRSLYTELLGEYRKQKRVVSLAEEDVRTEERNRIARDIHDSVGHQLTALIMRLEMLAIQTKNDDYRELKKMAENSLDETRQAVQALQTEESEGIATVVNLVRKLEAESQIVVQFTMKQGVLTVPLSNQHSVALYRVIQEALTNAMRHGQSREVHIVLGKSAIGDVSFEVSNVVHEMSPIQFGFGLMNMKQRVETINGRLDVYQQDNQFIVSGIIPAK